MDNAGTPGKPPKASASPTDDIPVAVREHFDAPPKFWTKRIVLVSGLVGIGAIALASGAWFALQLQRSSPVISNAATPPTQPTAPNASPNASPKDTLLGHFPYSEAPQADLVPISEDGGIRMRKAAAKSYRQMVDAARADGVSIIPISGFRSLEDQKHLFFDVKAERGQVTTKRAEVSAPPGYSEHHTGYAVDVGDGDVPSTNLNPNFEKTPAFKWLQTHAAYYSFELSFPKGNPQGVSYEPWHWRFVGDQTSLETFYKARSQ